jgi:hypothetical protein
MMDYVDVSVISTVLADSLFEDNGVHPLTACERLISAAANGWQEARQGRYRDDIAIAVSTVREPPVAKAGDI